MDAILSIRAARLFPPWVTLLGFCSRLAAKDWMRPQKLDTDKQRAERRFA
jgi:hypothetical protein